MIKYLVLLAVVGAVIWWLRRARPGDERQRPQARAANSKGKDDAASSASDSVDAKPALMLACAHCGVHLPQADALTDAAGRPFCGEAHRLAGPR